MSDVPSSQYISNFTYYIDNRKKNRPWPNRLGSYKEENFFLFMILLDK